MSRVIGIIIIICLVCSFVQAQQSFIEKFNLPQYDCEQKAFAEVKKMTIVVPDDPTAVEYAKWFEEYYGASRGLEMNIKTEKQLQKSDFKDNLCILGPINSYSHWKRIGIPVKKLRRGFKIGKFSFKNPSYGFSYTSPPETYPFRLVISGNNLKSFKQATDELFLGFEFVVLKDFIPQFVGNGSRFVNLNALMELHYTPIESKYFVFMVSENLILGDEKDNNAEIKKYDSHVEAFVEKMRLDLPDEKIKMYVHATQAEIKYFSGWFNKMCEEGITYGTVVGNVINSWNWEAIEHEANHHIFNRQVNEAPAIFLCEGVPIWYEYTKNAEMKNIGFQKAIEFADYDLTNVICGKENFFQGDKYYLISGIFTDYLIDTFGLDKFKEVYRYRISDILSGFERTYGKPLSDIRNR